MPLSFVAEWLNRAGEPDWNAGYRRFYQLSLRSFPLATLVHVCFCMIFGLLGAWPLVWFNIGSVVWWVITCWLLHQRRLEAAIYLACIEVALHGVFASIVIGWRSGFHVYILFLTAMVFTVSVRRITYSCAFLLLSSWTALFFFTANSTPWIALPVPLLGGMAFANYFCLTFLLAFIFLRSTELADQMEGELERENKRSLQLLHNILPASIAERLLAGEEPIADGFEEASVLFSDIVGFTILSSKVTPAELVVLLNRVFSRIDALVAHYGLEKIKTIGDAYMVASGIPVARADHVEVLADFSLDMLKVIEEFGKSVDSRLEMRIGMHTGPVVAGVIGIRKFAYDLWGDTVNIAARMESHGVPGQIQLTEAVHERLKDSFDLEEKGLIEVKGKGKMKTFFLKGRKSLPVPA